MADHLPVCGVDGCQLRMQPERIPNGAVFYCKIPEHAKRVAVAVVKRG